MSDTDSAEIIEGVEGDCPCCGYHGKLKYIDEETAGPPKRQRKRPRLAAPKSEKLEQSFLHEFLAKREAEVEPVIDPNDCRAYIQAFFDKYPKFDYNPSYPTMREFYRMCEMFEWKRDTPAIAEAHIEIRDALTKQFNAIYGTNENDLAAWQNLCRVLELPDIPDDLFRCRQLVRSTFVNIVDLIDTKKTEEPVRRFETEGKLSEYTQLTGKYFPKDNAYAGGFLKFLLRDIIRPGSKTNHSRPRAQRERNRRGV